MHESRHLQLSSLEGRVDSVEGGIAKAAPHTKQGEETSVLQLRKGIFT